MYGETIALTARESTKWNLITLGGQGIHSEILWLHFAMYQTFV